MKKTEGKSALGYYVATTCYKILAAVYGKIFGIIYSRLCPYFGFSAGNLISTINQSLKEYGAPHTKKFLEKKYRILRPACSKFLIDLVDLISKNTFHLRTKQTQKKQFIIHLCCWGSSYADKAQNYLLPSLLAEGNIPYLQKKFEITVHIDCDHDTASAFRQLPVVKQLQTLSNVSISALPAPLLSHLNASMSYPRIRPLNVLNNFNHVLKYTLFGVLQAKALRFAKCQNAYISFLIPDSILSSNFYLAVCNNLQNRKLALSSTFRTHFSLAKNQIDRFQRKDGCLSIAAKEMTGLQIKHLHPTDERRILSEQTSYYLPCARLIFKTNSGLVMRAFHYHPILINTDTIELTHCKINLSPIDDAVMAEILSDDTPYEDQVWMCSDSALANFMELSDDEPMALEPKLYGNAHANYDQLLEKTKTFVSNGGLSFNNKVSLFLLKNRLSFNTSCDIKLSETHIDDSRFVDDLSKLIGQL